MVIVIIIRATPRNSSILPSVECGTSLSLLSLSPCIFHLKIDQLNTDWLQITAICLLLHLRLRIWFDVVAIVKSSQGFESGHLSLDAPCRGFSILVCDFCLALPICGSGAWCFPTLFRSWRARCSSAIAVDEFLELLLELVESLAVGKTSAIA